VTGVQTCALPIYKNDTDLKVLIIQTSIEDKHIVTMEIKEKIKHREEGRTLLREMSDGGGFRINNDQLPQLNPNVTIDALRDDLDN
jgi:hypothetical protein